MVIACPECKARYRIDPSSSKSAVARVKCPECKFVFAVPLSADADGRVTAPQAIRPVVLIVDDARFFREMIKDILKDLPIELDTAADGNEAWQKVSSITPQLVLLDLNIPGMSGRDLLQALRNSSQAGQVKVLVMSAVERGEEIAAEVRRCGAEDFISKSFKPSELQSRVCAILGL